MFTVHLLSLLLALSLALNVGFCAGIADTRAGGNIAHALLVGGSAAGTSVALFLAGVSAYR